MYCIYECIYQFVTSCTIFWPCLTPRWFSDCSLLHHRKHSTVRDKRSVTLGRLYKFDIVWQYPDSARFTMTMIYCHNIYDMIHNVWTISHWWLESCIQPWKKGTGQANKKPILLAMVRHWKKNNKWAFSPPSLRSKCIKCNYLALSSCQSSQVNWGMKLLS